MSKAIIIAVVGTLLILCIGAQVVSLSESESDQDAAHNNNYYLNS